jgi:hypothetical protein
MSSCSHSLLVNAATLTHRFWVQLRVVAATRKQKKNGLGGGLGDSNI